MTRPLLLLSALCAAFTLAACSDKGDDSGGTSGDGGSEVVGDATSGESLYSNCAGCHGTDGSGGIDIGGTPSADLTVRVPALDDTALAGVISDGFGTAMPSQYTDAQDVADVVAYLRVTFP